MKKRKKQSKIPRGIYCDYCSYWHFIWWDTSKAVERLEGDYSMYNEPEKVKKLFEDMYEHPYKHKRKECQFRDSCKEETCDDCKEEVSYCAYRNYKEYGPYALGDQVKICGIKEDIDWDEEDAQIRIRHWRFKRALKCNERRLNKKRKTRKMAENKSKK